MRNEKIKNELNELPQKFDRESLWASIDLPKKKRKRRGFYWVFIAGILLMSMVLAIYSELNINPKESSTEKENIEKGTAIKAINKVENTQLLNDQSIDKFSNSNSQQVSNEPNGKGSDMPFYEKDEKNIKSLISEHKTNSNAINAQHTSIQSIVIDSKQTEALYVSKHSLSKENNLMIDDELLSTSTSILNGNYVSLATAKSLPVIDLKELVIQPLQFDLKPNLINSNSNHDKPFFTGISVFSLIGKSDHDFENATNRQETEKPLESISVGILGEFRVNNFDLFSGFSISRYNTHLTTSVEDVQLINSLQNLVQKNIKTDYSLYNSYQYIDFVLGLGYNFPIGKKWRITPSVQIGYSLNFNADGEILNSENQLIELSELSSYSDFSKWQGLLNLKISRKLNEFWGIGLITFITTQKALGRFDIYDHSVSSRGVGISINRILR